jgi:hypothetical protein
VPEHQSHQTLQSHQIQPAASVSKHGKQQTCIEHIYYAEQSRLLSSKMLPAALQKHD